MRQGFSLLELSIVLVIIGLITGGIMAGQSMVRAAEIRSVLSDVSKYKTALNLFKDRYQAIPGDMKNATAYWGIAAGTAGNDATCRAQSSTDPRTCDGNGNQIISGTSPETESYRFWQHVANAGLIEGQYTGVVASTGGYVAGENVPRSRVTDVGYSFWTVGTGYYAGSTSWFAGYFGHILNAGLNGAGNAFTSQETQLLDAKYDNGLPATGALRAISWATCTTATSETDMAATYRLTTSGKICGISFPNFLD